MKGSYRSHFAAISDEMVPKNAPGRPRFDEAHFPSLVRGVTGDEGDEMLGAGLTIFDETTGQIFLSAAIFEAWGPSVNFLRALDHGKRCHVQGGHPGVNLRPKTPLCGETSPASTPDIESRR
jgi:hypothetical protein